MNLIIKGFIIGVGKIMPGVSGALLAITLGIYEKLLNAIANIKKDFINNVTFLTKVAIGILLAIILTSKIIVKCLDNYYFPTMLLFIGMIVGGTKELKKEIDITKKDIILILITTIILILTTINTDLSITHQIEYTPIFFFKIISIGFLDATASIIPGISGTAILMTLGYYNIILEMFGTLLNPYYMKQNIFIVPPFTIGIVLGIFTVSKALNVLFKKFKNLTYKIILIFTTITTLILIKNILLTNPKLIDILIGIPLFILGVVISIKLGNK